MNLSILTPSQVFFNDEVESVIVPSSDGQLGILRGHCPLVTSFETGFLQTKLNEFAVLNGFVKVQQNQIMVLCRSVFVEQDLENESLESLEKQLLESEESFKGNPTVQSKTTLQKSRLLLSFFKKIKK